MPHPVPSVGNDSSGKIELVNFFIISVLTLFFLLTPSLINAQENWTINAFDSEIEILSNGQVNIVETINVDFGSLQKHGIFRDIPFAYTASDGAKTYTEVVVTRVRDGAGQVPYEVFTTGDFVRVKIGDPDKTITGEQSYRIEYTATGVLRSFDSHDELFWNVTGSNWPVPISEVSASVTLPSEAITKITCFQGTLGSNEACTSKKLNDKVATFFSKGSLGPKEGLTVVVGYTSGLVPITTVAPPENPFDNLFSLQSIAISLVTIAAGGALVFFLWWRRGRDYWVKQRFADDPNAKHEIRPVGAHETVVVEYTPPENLRPAEVGTLIDEKAHTADVTATIIDLATRGFLKIKELEKKWLFGSVDYELTKIQKDTNSLVDYERELLDRIFDEGDKVKLSDLKTKFYKDLKKVKEELYKEMINKKFFYENPESVRRKYMFFGLGVGIFGGVLLFIGMFLPIILLIPFAVSVGLTGVMLLIFSNFMPRKTAHGREMFRRIKGYELFVSKAEKYRQQFFERKNLFNEVLPYAIVFGATEKFAKAFKDIGIEPRQPSWYTGTRPFNAAVFGVSMASFSNSLGSAMAATPGGSGFSGGGAGGGFGGGGGGSW